MTPLFGIGVGPATAESASPSSNYASTTTRYGLFYYYKVRRSVEVLHCYSNRIISNRVLAQRKAQMVQSNIASSSKANLLAVGYRKTRAKMRQNRDKKAKWRTHIFEQGNHGNRKGELRKGGRVTNYAKQQESRRIHELLESKEIKKKKIG